MVEKGKSGNVTIEAQQQDMQDSRDSRDYQAAALFLAKRYGGLLKEKEYIDKVLSGEFVFTEDDALEELISTTAGTESDTGVRVQTSNISNTTERIGILLVNGYVEKRNRELRQEILADNEGREYLNWKIDIIGTALSERMDKFERGLFKRRYVEQWTYRRIRERYQVKKLYNRDISKACRAVISSIADEIQLRENESCCLVDRLMAEAGDDMKEAYHE